MKKLRYRVINHTTLEILDTDDKAVASKWMDEWKKEGCNVEMIDNYS